MVRFENVGLRYGMGPEVLRDITFSIEPQSFQFLTGPSGAARRRCCGILSSPSSRREETDQPVRPRRRLDRQGYADGAAPAHGRRLPGFPPARAPHDLRERGAAAARAGARRRLVSRRGGGLLRWVGLGESACMCCRRCSRAGRSSAPPSPAPSSPSRSCCCRRADRQCRPKPRAPAPGLFVELNKAGTAIVIATHDIALMDQFDAARRLVLGDGRLRVYD